jgi:glutathione S-transferase
LLADSLSSQSFTICLKIKLADNIKRLSQSRAHRILWLLEELKVDYELQIFKRGKDMLAPKELKEIHPLGKSPVLSVQAPNEPKPRVIAESAFIVEYLLDHYGQNLIPQRYPTGKEGEVGEEKEEWMRYRYYMHYAEGSIMPLMVFALILDRKLESYSRGDVADNINRDQESTSAIFYKAYYQRCRRQSG